MAGVLQTYSLVKTRQDGESAAQYLPCLPLFTPVGHRAPLYHSPSKWSSLAPAKSLKDTPLTNKRALAEHLYMNTYGEVWITSELLNGNQRARAQLQRLFADGAPARNGSSKWYHTLMQCVTLDRVSWALAPFERGGFTQRAHAQPAGWKSADRKSANIRSAAFQNALESCKKWQTSMSNFLQGWTVRNEDPSGRSVQPPKDDSSGKSAIASLGAAMTSTANSAKIDTVEANFCALALALSALAQVSMTCLPRTLNVANVHTEGTSSGGRSRFGTNWAAWRPTLY